MTVIDDLLRNNAEYASGFDRGGLAAPPALKLAVLACMDSRIDVEKVLGLNDGDAHVIRNAGGLATEDAIRSLIISHHVLGTEEIVVIHHTRCGMHTFVEEELKDRVAGETGARPPFDLGSITDLESGLRDAVTTLQESPFIRYRNVRGFAYDVDTGTLEEVRP